MNRSSRPAGARFAYSKAPAGAYHELQYTINTMSNDTIIFNKKEALRYFRDVAYEKLRNELQPRYTVKRFGCRADAAFVWLDNGTVFRSKALARYVGEATELYLFGATLGSRVDSALRRMALTSVAEAGAGQAVAAALIETYCDDCCAELQKQLPEGKKLKWRFSPGYGDWSLEEQKILFPVLDCAHTIGLTLTESCMMAPVKSVTAVMAITEDAIRENHKCQYCNKTDCEFRQKE